MAKVIELGPGCIVDARLPASHDGCRLVSRETASDGGAEWRWAAAITIAILVLVEVPYLVAYAQAARGYVFVGMFWSPHDVAQYGAAMHEGAAGAWLIHDHFSHEPHPRAFMYALYVALGKVAAALGLDFQLSYHLAEIAARAVLLLSVYLLAAAVLATVRQRRMAFILILLSSGIGPLLAAGAGLAGLEARIPILELSFPELSTVLVLFTAPHMTLGLALLLLAGRCYVSAWPSSSWPISVVAGVSALGVGLTNSYSVVPLVAAVGGHLAAMRLCRRPLAVGAIRAAAMIVLGAAPILGYSLLVFRDDGFWHMTYGGLAGMVSPPPQDVLITIGGVAVLAMAGLPAFLRRAGPSDWLVPVWIVMTLILMYLPIGVARRFALGLQPMLGIVAAVGLDLLVYWLGRHRSH